MRTSKRNKSRQAADAAALAAFFAAEQSTEPVVPQDPALLAATILLAHALHADGTSFAIAGRDGVLVTIRVPDSSWMPLVKETWRHNARGGKRAVDGYRAHEWDSGDWWCWAPEEPPKDYASKAQSAVFARAVASLRHCAGIAPDLAWLPEDLVLAADHQLVLPALTASDIVEIARELCGDHPDIRLMDADAVLLTPRLLRLARRVGQTADSYTCKLRDLLRRDVATQATRSQALAESTVRDQPTLERLHGMAKAVEWGSKLANDIKLFREGRIRWADVDRGVLLSGPPGCGKTTFARALATTCEVPLVVGSYSEWHASGSGHQGDFLKAMRRTFAAAREVAPSILFIDEIDSFPDRSKLTHSWADYEIQIVNALLAEIDGVQSRDGVVLVGACNLPSKLDAALVRSGRLDQHIRVGLPDINSLVRIMREHLGADLAGSDLRAAAVLAAGTTGADVERFVRLARGRARRAGRDISMDDLLSEIAGAGADNPTLVRIAATHEAGHAVACSVLQLGLSAVSIRSASGGGGLTFVTDATMFLSATDVRNRLVARLAGRAAEELIFGQPTSGAGGGSESDLAAVTMLAVSAASALGLDNTTGLIWLGLPEYATLPEMIRNNPRLAARVREVIHEAYQEALHLLRENRAALEAVAELLEKHQALDKTGIASIIEQHRAKEGHRHEQGSST